MVRNFKKNNEENCIKVTVVSHSISRKELPMLISHDILHYLGSADLSKSFSIAFINRFHSPIFYAIAFASIYFCEHYSGVFFVDLFLQLFLYIFLYSGICVDPVFTNLNLTRTWKEANNVWVNHCITHP